MAEIWKMVERARQVLLAKEGAEAFNIGINDGTAAGQTIDHAHVHLIPRCKGDVPDPRGGIRWVIPAKAAYWSEGS
jgi:diadenosine tetraphosphate (Ap4A) HIT family hydrolase